MTRRGRQQRGPAPLAERDGEGYLRLPFGAGRHAPIASADQSRVIAALGFPVHYEPIGVDEFAAAMTVRGLPAHLVQHLSNVAVDYQNGVFAGMNDNVARIGGRAPLSVDAFVIAHKPAFETSGPNFVPARG